MLSTLLTLLILLLTTPAAGQTLVDHYVAGMQARAAGEFERYLAEFEAADRIEPGHPVLQFHLARACANTGSSDDALAWLDLALRQGAWLDLRGDEWLAPLHEDTGWNTTLALADSVGAHHGEGRVGFELEEYDLLPEGIEYDPVLDRFLLGSVKRKILIVDREGGSEVFIDPARDGLLVPLGLRVDSGRRRLWAVSASDANLAVFTPDEAGQTRVHCWSLDDASLLGSWAAPVDTLDHSFNDLALHPDGSVVITDATAGALYQVGMGDAAVRELVAPGALRGPNGISINAEGTRAWVAEYVYGVSCVDLATGEFEPVGVPDTLALIGVDGLYHHDGELVVVQNYAGLDRAAAFRLDESGCAVTAVRVLEARHPRTKDPTTGVIVGDEFWYIANSNIAGFDIRQAPADPQLGPVLILRTQL